MFLLTWIFQFLYVLLPLLFLGGCATVHQHQMSNIDTETTIRGSRFEIILSEKDVNMSEKELGTNLSKKMVKDKLKREEKTLLRSIATQFTFAPVSTNPIFIEDYADKLAEMILRKCPNGNITGLSTTRERGNYTRGATKINGAIVRVTGYCWRG